MDGCWQSAQQGYNLLQLDFKQDGNTMDAFSITRINGITLSLVLLVQNTLGSTNWYESRAILMTPKLITKSRMMPLSIVLGMVVNI